MHIAFDAPENARTVANRGLSFELVADPDCETAAVREDRRRDYGERRVLVSAFLANRLHLAVVTYQGVAVHVISFRKASRKELQPYEQQKR